MSTRSTSPNTEMTGCSVTIAIRSRQRLDSQDFVTRQDLSGTLRQTDTGWLLTYREETSDGAVDTRLTLEEAEGTLARTGAVHCRMAFVPGETGPAPYETALGRLDLQLSTTYFRHDLTHSGGSVLVRYTLSAQGQSLGNYTLQLHIKEKDD